MSRGTDTGFGIRDLPQESTIKAKIRPLVQNRDFLGPFLDLFGTFSCYLHENAKNMRKGQKMSCCRNISNFKIYLMVSRYERAR